MSTQLDILALEPFYGGVRRHMLETVLRCSRHRWTLLKLPPRRIERRLSVAANWFAEHLKTHWSGRVDILFTSEAMNLASLYRLVPGVARQPSVVYFHENQIPTSSSPARKLQDRRMEDPGKMISRLGAMPMVAPPPREREPDLELVNLNTATAATEIWFNSAYHQRTFIEAAKQLVGRHPELASHNPMAGVAAKAVVMPPPIDLNLIPYVKSLGKAAPRDPRAIFVDTRDANFRILNAALAELASRGEKFRLITVGPVQDLSDTWTRRTVSEADDLAQGNGLLEAGVVLSARSGAGCDIQVIRGLQAGCKPVLPLEGIYADLIPASLHTECLYHFSVDDLADSLQDAINPAFAWDPPDFRQSLKQFEAISATKLFDERLSHLAASHAVG
ncbi:MAG TPA: DUF3524 domain-containing protein [Tepidisphaeraceae bacterium]|jgi:hypothetical protein|nr:DUF3524 domain-containing protein [Tepidisphaeraceae bacterium]